MSALTLKYPVHTLDGQILLPCGTVLSAETLDALIASNKAECRQIYSPLQHETVKKDLVRFISQPPYHAIFSDPREVVEILDTMEKMHTIAPVLQSLEYFKQHDFDTYRHILTVSALSILLAKTLLPEYRDRVQEAGLGPIHDVGKVCVPLYILKKASPLTRTERDILKHHAAAGYVLLAYHFRDKNSPEARIARDHHERDNGSGYPRGVQITNPMVDIVALCDVYDALISPRPYRPASYDNRTALEVITDMAERNEISWDIVKALVARNREAKPHYSECTVSKEKRGVPPQRNVYGVTAEE